MTDMYLENGGHYVDGSRMFAYEYTDGVLYKGVDRVKTDMTIDMLETQIADDLSKRTGIVDEVGVDEYFEILGAEQQKQRENG